MYPSRHTSRASTPSVVSFESVYLDLSLHVPGIKFGPRPSFDSFPNSTPTPPSFALTFGSRSVDLNLDSPSKFGLNGTVRVPLHEAESRLFGKKVNDKIYIDWKPGTACNPINFSYGRKWFLTILACFFSVLSSSTTSSYTTGFPSMLTDLQCTLFQAAIGLSVFALGFGIVPLFTASLSEEFGRRPLYLFSVALFLLGHVGTALSPNILSVQLFRFLVGAAGSTGATMVGGTVADIWSPEERGLPMALFAISVFSFTGIGSFWSSWVEQFTSHGWRWIQWAHVVALFLYFIFVFFFMSETRNGVILTNMAKKIRNVTGDNRYRARIEDERASLSSLVYVSCTRPILLLLTEPVVAAFSLWMGFAWGVLFSLIESIAPAFRQLHKFTTIEIGTVFLTLTIGSIFGLLTNVIQERMYQKKFPERGPEARLYASMFAGILFPAGMFIYAFSASENIHWTGMAFGVMIFMWACFVMYLACFTYLADCYGTYASSALAGQSLCRNLAATAFPLFSEQLYNKITFKYSSVLFGGVALLMAPVPFILFFWGPAIRARSKFASQLPKLPF